MTDFPDIDNSIVAEIFVAWDFAKSAVARKADTDQDAALNKMLDFFDKAYVRVRKVITDPNAQQ